MDRSILEELRNEIPITREEAFRFVSDGFKARIEVVYVAMGRPDLSLSNGWWIFQELRNRIRSGCARIPSARR